MLRVIPCQGLLEVVSGTDMERASQEGQAACEDSGLLAVSTRTIGDVWVNISLQNNNAYANLVVCAKKVEKRFAT